jgi:hypothetical protein
MNTAPLSLGGMSPVFHNPNPSLLTFTMESQGLGGLSHLASAYRHAYTHADTDTHTDTHKYSHIQ